MLTPCILQQGFDLRCWWFGFGNAIYIKQLEESLFINVGPASQPIHFLTTQSEEESQAKVSAWHHRVNPWPGAVAQSDIVGFLMHRRSEPLWSFAVGVCKDMANGEMLNGTFLLSP